MGILGWLKKQRGGNAGILGWLKKQRGEMRGFLRALKMVYPARGPRKIFAAGILEDAKKSAGIPRGFWKISAGCGVYANPGYNWL